MKLSALPAEGRFDGPVIPSVFLADVHPLYLPVSCSIKFGLGHFAFLTGEKHPVFGANRFSLFSSDISQGTLVS